MAIPQRVIFNAAFTAFLCSAISSSASAQALVRLNAAATQASGEPDLDLKLEDFQITDQAKPQRIALFRPSRESAFDAAPLAAHQLTNRTNGARAHSAVILFDLLNQNQMDRLDTWHRLGKSLAQLQSGESTYFYLLTLEGNLVPIHPLGGKSGDDKTWTHDVEKELDKAMKAASHARPLQMNDMEMIVKKTYVAFETLANQLAMLPGRRDIIWITNGIPNVWNPKTPCNGDWVECALYVSHLSVTLDRANVAIDPLSYSSDPSPDATRDLEQVADLTGGVTYFREDMRAVLEHVARDAATSYWIDYEPAKENWDSKFHKIRVTAEHKNSKLRARSRYFAYPDAKPEALQQAALAAAFQSASDDPGIGLRALAVAATGGKSVNVEFRIDPADLLLREEGGQLTGTLTYLIADMGPTGPVGNPVISRFEVRLSAEQRDKALKEGVPIAQDHPLAASIQKIRVIVQDQSTNSTGSLTIPLSQ
jgi:VWFA-related protein